MRELDHLLIATRRLDDHESRTALQRIGDHAVAHPRARCLRRPWRAHDQMTIDDARVFEADPRAEARYRVGWVGLRRGPENAVVPVAAVGELLDYDVRTVDHHVEDLDA